MIGLVSIRVLPSDESGSLRGATLEDAVNEDKGKGLIPFYVSRDHYLSTAVSRDNLSLPKILLVHPGELCLPSILILHNLVLRTPGKIKLIVQSNLENREIKEEDKE